MRVFSYARCSMDQEGTEREQNPELQLGPMRAEIARRAWTNAGEFIDMESGGEIRRIQFGEMLRRVANHEADLVMVWKADRFCRLEPMEAIVILYQLQTFGCGFYSLTEQYISSLAENPIPVEWRLPVISMVFAGAYAERKKISERTKAGIENKRLCETSPNKRHSVEDGKCIHCQTPIAKIWKGGRPKGSKDKKERKAPIYRPEMRATDLFKQV